MKQIKFFELLIGSQIEMALGSRRKWRCFSTAVKTSFFLFLFALSASATPNPLYFSWTGSGSQSGADSNNCQSLAWVNNQANWGSGPGQISAGTSLVVVGVVGRMYGIYQNNITLLIPGGSGIYSPNTAIYVNNGIQNFTIDGQGGGFISSYNNGSPPLANQVSICAINCGGSVQNLCVKNIAITNIYVHTSLTDNAIQPDQCCGIYANGLGGSNFFGNIYFQDVGTAIYTIGLCTEVISNCTFQRCNHGIYPSAVSGNTTVVIENNYFGSSSNWDTTANTYHNDSIIWGSSTGAINSMSVIGNTFNGDMGNNNTAYVFFFANPAYTNYFFNNVFRVWPGNYLNDGCIVFNGANGFMLNNTFIGNGGNNAITTTGNGLVFENNLMFGFGTFISIAGAFAGNTFNNNLYGNPISKPQWVISGTDYTTFPSFTNAVNEGASRYIAAGSIIDTSTGIPAAGGPAIGTGLNLSNYFQTDITGAARSSTGMWTIGAYASSVAVAAVQPPLSVHSVTPVAEWTFNDGAGSTALDSTTNGDTGKLVNNPAWVPGQSARGYALSFDGSSQYMTASNPLPSFANLSYSCWIRCGSQKSSTVLASGQTGLVFNSGNAHHLTFTTDGNFNDGAVSSAITDDGNWHFIVGTCGGTNLIIYVDGVQTGSATINSVLAGGPLFVGWDNGMLDGYYPGMVDDVRVYNQVLSPATVSLFYNAGAQ